MGLSRLLEFRGKLKEACELLDQARTVIAAMMIIDEFTALNKVEAMIARALELVREARRIGRELMEEADRALSYLDEEDEEGEG